PARRGRRRVENGAEGQAGRARVRLRGGGMRIAAADREDADEKRRSDPEPHPVILGAGDDLRRLAPLDARLQPGRVLEREALPVVVEVGVDVDVLAPLLDPPRPPLELLLAVVAALPLGAGVEADERPAGGELERLED